MKHLTKLLPIIMAGALLLCAAGCVKNKKEKTPAGSSSETTAPSATTLPAVEGVEDWAETPSQPAGQQTTGQETTEKPTTEQPTTSDSPLTLKEYNAMTTAQQQAYFESFPNPDAFYEWLEEAEKADKEQGNTITGNGSLDLNDYINNNK